MTPLKLSLITGGVVALLTLGGLHHLRQGRMHEATRLRTENNRIRLEASRRHQARLAQGEADRTKAVLNSPVVAKAAGSPATDSMGDRSAAVSRVPGTEYRNEGQGTPVAAMQTVAWACDQGDAVLMGNLIHFDAAARPKAEAFLSSLPVQVRAQWATPEAMAAALLISAGINSPYPVASIIAQARVEELGAGRKVLHLPGTGRERIEYQETPAGWKYAITEAMVDDYIRRTTAQAKGGR